MQQISWLKTKSLTVPLYLNGVKLRGIKAVVMIMIKLLQRNSGNLAPPPPHIKEPEFVFIQGTSYILSRYNIPNLLNTTERNYYKSGLMIYRTLSKAYRTIKTMIQ
jgi:hypothetical protein